MSKDIESHEDPDATDMTSIANAGMEAVLNKARVKGADVEAMGVLVVCVADENASESLAGIAAHIDSPVNGLEIALGAAQSLAETAGVGISLMRLPKGAKMQDSADDN